MHVGSMSKRCSVKIAWPSSSRSGHRITLAIIMKGCVHRQRMRYVCFDICMLEIKCVSLGPPGTCTITQSHGQEMRMMCVCVCVLVFNLRQSVGGPMAVKSMAEVRSSSTPRMCGQCDFFFRTKCCFPPTTRVLQKRVSSTQSAL